MVEKLVLLILCCQLYKRVPKWSSFLTRKHKEKLTPEIKRDKPEPNEINPAPKVN
jgi:hypothetical protein